MLLHSLLLREVLSSLSPIASISGVGGLRVAHRGGGNTVFSSSFFYWLVIVLLPLEIPYQFEIGILHDLG